MNKIFVPALILSFSVSTSLPGWSQTTSPALEIGQKIAANSYVRYQEPDFLTFDELKKLSENPLAEGGLERKLNRFWKTPGISNEAYYSGAKPHRPQDPKLGPYLRLVSWNIEKSYHIDEAIALLTSLEGFEKQIDREEAPPDSKRDQLIHLQRERLLNADIFVLQEMDIGVKRSGYRNAPRDLAHALNMNYAYSAEQLEVDPVMLGTEKINLEDGKVDQEATDYYAVDPARYKGLFGTAVLSKYPIKHAEVFQLENQAYNWYDSEKKKTTYLENSRRFGAKTVFRNEVTREIKVGGRNYFRVDLDVPGVEGGTLTIINIHLEIKCQPKGRAAQIAEILSYIRDIKNPVIVVGDFNLAPEDLSPTSVTRTASRAAKNPTNWFSAAVAYLSPHALAINTSRAVSNFTKNFQDPTSRHIPIVGPNSLKPFFNIMEDFRSNDGGNAFDFRGDKKRSVNGNDGKLANANQRDRKGFKTTFSVKRPYGPIGKHRLDWVFVKSHLKDPHDRSGPYKFAPHYGETLEELNTSLTEPVSDHHPNVVDIPFEEPKI